MYFYDYLPDNIKFPVKIDTSTGYLHYLSKKFSYSESILTYPVKLTERMVKPIIKNVEEFTTAANTRELPDPLQICIKADFKKGRSKDCFMSDLCKQYYYDGVKKC